MRTNRLLSVIGSTFVILTCGVSWGTAPEVMSRDDMAGLRGGGSEARRCSQTCNAANGYINLCPKADGSACTTCTNGSTTTFYVDMDPICGNGGWKSGTNTTDCGVQQTGTCTAITVCTITVQTKTSCSDPVIPVAQ